MLNRIALFALILTLPIVLEGVPASLTPYAEKAHLALSESLTRLYELNRNRNAGWITPDEYAARIRSDVIPRIALSAVELSRLSQTSRSDGTWLASSARTLQRKHQELETIALIFETEDRLLDVDALMRKRQFDSAASTLDLFWVSDRQRIEAQIAVIDEFSSDAAQALRTDLERFNEAALRLEFLLAERHLSTLKAAAFSQTRAPAASGDNSEWEALHASTRAQIQRFDFLARMSPSESIDPYRNRFTEIDRLFGGDSLP